MMIDSVVWSQYINVTDTQTAASPQQMPRQCTASGGKMNVCRSQSCTEAVVLAAIVHLSRGIKILELCSTVQGITPSLTTPRSRALVGGGNVKCPSTRKLNRNEIGFVFQGQQVVNKAYQMPSNGRRHHAGDLFSWLPMGGQSHSETLDPQPHENKRSPPAFTLLPWLGPEFLYF